MLQNRILDATLKCESRLLFYKAQRMRVVSLAWCYRQVFYDTTLRKGFALASLYDTTNAIQILGWCYRRVLYDATLENHSQLLLYKARQIRFVFSVML